MGFEPTSLGYEPSQGTSPLTCYDGRIYTQELSKTWLFAKSKIQTKIKLFPLPPAFMLWKFKKVATPFGQVFIFLLPEAESRLSRVIWIRSLRVCALSLWFKFKCPPHSSATRTTLICEVVGENRTRHSL